MIFHIEKYILANFHKDSCSSRFPGSFRSTVKANGKFWEVAWSFCKLFRFSMLWRHLASVSPRDSRGVAQVCFVTDKILRILKSKGLTPDLPKDIYYLIKKTVSIRKHLERNRKDKDSKFRLILEESRIRRLTRYYKTMAKRKAGGPKGQKTAPPKKAKKAEKSRRRCVLRHCIFERTNQRLWLKTSNGS